MKTLMHFYQDFGKRCLDLGVACVAIVIVAPLIGIIALGVRLKLGSPIFFTQIRPGKGGRPFRMYKFRTMTSECDATGRFLPDADRLTPFGSWLRSTSLDELPELWNVLRGDMSLVGPRPLLMEYLNLYTTEQARRHDVLPGLTGLAQINGRNAVSWEQKFRHDLRYVDRLSFVLDLRILLRTVVIVFSRKGITAHGHATTPPFAGQCKNEVVRDAA